MYSNWPNATEVQVLMGSEIGSVKVSLTHCPTKVPQKCRDFIEKFGWEPSMTHPDTSEQLFHKSPPDNCSDETKKSWNYDLQTGHWYWYEAMAYEFGKFMGIDEDTGGASGDPQGSAASAPAGIQDVRRGGREA